MTHRLRPSRVFEMDLGLLVWRLLLGLSGLIAVTVIVPYYATGLLTHPPTLDAIASSLEQNPLRVYFQGTIWAHPFWQDVTISLGCAGWCVWLPALLFAMLEMIGRWTTLSRVGKRWRVVGLGLVGLTAVLWFGVALKIFYLMTD